MLAIYRDMSHIWFQQHRRHKKIKLCLIKYSFVTEQIWLLLPRIFTIKHNMSRYF